MDKIAVVILNYNGKQYLEKFLPSVVSHSSAARIYVADNNSSDDSISYLKDNYPQISIIRIPENKGYSKGYNIALQAIQAEYYILLNSDVEVTSGWIEPVISLMDSEEQIAACQPKIKSFNNKIQFEYAGAAGGFIDKLGYPFCRGRIFDVLEEDHGQYDADCEIFWASGACLFIKAKLFHRVKGFDQDFFAHMEEIDLCWKLKNQGFKIYYCGKSQVYHVGGGTLSKASPQKTYLNFRNNISLLYQNLPSNRLYSILLVRLLLDGLAAIKFLFSDSFGHFTAIIRAHFAIYGSFRRLKAKRTENLSKRTSGISNLKGIYQGSIVYDHFVHKTMKFTDIRMKD
jgi:GT2 family glycosyltransferase